MTIQNIERSIKLLELHCDMIQSGRCNDGVRQGVESLRSSQHTILQSQIGSVSNPNLIRRIETVLKRSEGLRGSFYPSPSHGANRPKSCWQTTQGKFSDVAALPLIGGLLSSAYLGYHYFEPIKIGVQTGLNFASLESIHAFAQNAFQLFSSAGAIVNEKLISLAEGCLSLTTGQTLMGLGALSILYSVMYAKTKAASIPVAPQTDSGRLVFGQV